MSAANVPVTVMVLTLNEARNLPACLESVAGWASRVVVIDSGSTDRTAEIATRAGASVVTHAFETHASQWEWALRTVPIDTEWVLALDADQRVSPELRASIERALATAGDVNGFFLRRRQVFRGRWIRHGGYYPKLILKLFKKSAVSFDAQELVDHHFHISGRTSSVSGDLIEDNRNESAIADWTAKHNRYAVLQAREEWERARRVEPMSWRAMFSSPDARTRSLKRLWCRLPLFVRPVLYVGYRYIFRLGFLDGKQGFVFHVLQGFWYRLLVDINLDELRSART